MLPESFAVVCAPKSTPKYVLYPFSCASPEHRQFYHFHSFGIFRLTDPPGLQTILGCHAKEAFHPHPDLPIYTVRLLCPVFPVSLFWDSYALFISGIPWYPFSGSHDLERIIKDADKGHVQMKDMPLEIVDLR